jgi:outer membrane protein
VLPELSLGGTRGSNLNRGGAGSTLPVPGPDDESWSLALSAQWPIYFGGALRARINQEEFSLTRLERERAALVEGIEAETRAALHRASGSYPAVELSLDASRAATENLALVTDAYSRGAVSVTDLIDAQNTALAAELRAADSQYAYLIDLVDILRATADFSLLIDTESTEAWFQRVEAYFRERGVTLRQ